MVKKIINNRELYCEVVYSKAKGRMTPVLLDMLLTIGSNLIVKFNFPNEDYKFDCLYYGHYRVLANWMEFNEIVYNNPFAYYTEIYKRAFAYQFNQLRHNHLRIDNLEYINF